MKETKVKNKSKKHNAISTRHNTSLSSKNSTAGITLIALVITIIVLLILAGVSIATLTGNRGIIPQAAKAMEETEMARIKEEAELVKASRQIGI